MEGEGGEAASGPVTSPLPHSGCLSPALSVSLAHDLLLHRQPRAPLPRRPPAPSRPAPSPHPAFPPNPSSASQLTVKSEAVPQSQAPREAPAAAAASCRPRPGTRPRAAAMAPGHEAPRLPGLGQTPGGAQEKPMELPALAVAPTGAAAARDDDVGGRAVGAG